MTNHSIDDNKAYWDQFYKDFGRRTPSQFCVSVITDLEPEASIVELGSGNGRDSFFFAEQGFRTVAMDASETAIQKCEEHAAARGITHSYFLHGDITKEDDVAGAVANARAESASGCVTLYSRFVMHSLDDNQQTAFLATLGACTETGDVIYFEFRSQEDAALEKHYGGHYRRYVDTHNFTAELASIAGFQTTYSLTGQGMARFKEEDPVVSRVIAAKGA